jgi:hypothetical protein
MRTFDFVLKHDAADVAALKAFLDAECERWCFQIEEGESESKYLHYQGRFTLKTRKRLMEVRQMFVDVDAGMTGVHLSVTSRVNADNYAYVTKSRTRVEGPWFNEAAREYIPADVLAQSK